ncbi:bifunctional adenosylcobinamide kinase/adenosylcobinamide-phosphate guanylyltransferase [Motilibacter aurantiacus]|uniref:bifunctional adenosylcobinamide kinase/adenosylcobinamide-phosphate guanylyltransferase n=1 Tax=Motilibacter aurantiacus TaxID=2714955 RepID=UPI00140D69D2|nr:bifunctional adenosylcobinamide kinase/adenosylcobinamide-phosphate guanylyltransferase [Motilibacter aurantiacus]NHC44918.1 adenosylcobinamide kinase/adenosylcobinamide phosphate guanyltransferase [Motilibacter aurantiacus]
MPVPRPLARLLGTGAVAGWPEPGCPCASCALAAADPRAPWDVRVGAARLPDPALGVGEHAVVDGVCVRRTAPGAWEAGPLDGPRLLLVTAPGPVPAPAGPYALVLLGDADPAALAWLRRCGAVGPATDVVAVGLSHRHRPDQLPRELAAVGVRAVPDGHALDLVGQPSRPLTPRRTLVLGGARSGKSAVAEGLLAAEPEVTYVATAPGRPDDPEWDARVQLHRQRRPAHWRTLETRDLVPLLAAEGPPLLVDCLALWLTTVLDECRAWDDPRAALPAVRERQEALVAAWRGTRRRAVAVSNEVGSGVVPATPSGRLFRDELGRLNAAIAAQSEQALLVVAGRVACL